MTSISPPFPRGLQRSLLNSVFACGLIAIASLQTAFAAPPNSAQQRRIDGETDRVLAPLKLDDPARTDRVRQVLGSWLVTLWNWHAQHDTELNTLWSEWNEARAVVPKDEFPGEVIAQRIDAIYASLKPACRTLLEELATALTPEQIDLFKETWSRSPGMDRTYRAYLEIVPDLTDEQKNVIRERMLLAREAAMLTDSDKEIVNLYKVHKVKVEAYIGTLQWAKLHAAYAQGGKNTAAPR